MRQQTYTNQQKQINFGSKVNVKIAQSVFEEHEKFAANGGYAKFIETARQFIRDCKNDGHPNRYIDIVLTGLKISPKGKFYINPINASVKEADITWTQVLNTKNGKRFIEQRNKKAIHMSPEMGIWGVNDLHGASFIPNQGLFGDIYCDIYGIKTKTSYSRNFFNGSTELKIERIDEPGTGFIQRTQTQQKNKHSEIQNNIRVRIKKAEELRKNQDLTEINGKIQQLTEKRSNLTIFQRLKSIFQ